MSRVVYCRRCADAYESLGGALPDECPSCKASALWTTEPVPKKPYRISENDRKFLRSLRILPEE